MYDDECFKSLLIEKSKKITIQREIDRNIQYLQRDAYIHNQLLNEFERIDCKIIDEIEIQKKNLYMKFQFSKLRFQLQFRVGTVMQ